MQLQFNNSPLGGGGRRIKRWERETRFFCCCCFQCLSTSSPPLKMGEKIGKREVACFFTLASRLDTDKHTHTHMARAVRCCCGCYRLDATDRMDFATGSPLRSDCRLCLLVRLTCEVEAPTPARTTTTQQQHEGRRSCSNPLQTLSGLLNRNNGIASSLLTARWLC